MNAAALVVAPTSAAATAAPGLYANAYGLPAEAWARAVSSRPYLDVDYLRALEEAAPPRLSFRYAFAAGRAAAFQVIDFPPHEHLPALFSPRAGERWWPRALRRTAALVLARARPRVLLCGNIFAGGEPGVTPGGYALAADAMESLRAAEAPRPQLLFFKDVPDDDLADARAALVPRGYREVRADPAMILELRPQWRTFDDYLDALTARYRGHARQALRASSGIERRLLSAEQMLALAPRIDELHEPVLARASVRPSALNAAGFIRLRARLGERFQVVGYWLGERLVGFNTRFVWPHEVESYYFGVDYSLNKRHALYRSMLYDDIAFALAHGARRVRFGRTSQEMKSALGARPVGATFFAKAGVPLVTALMMPLGGMVGDRWVSHQPFRAHTTRE